MGYRANMNSEMIELPVRRLGFGDPVDEALIRNVAVEAPVSLEVGGIGYAVMMAPPADPKDYAAGFALREGLAETPAQSGLSDVPANAGGAARRVRVQAGR